MDTKYMAGRIVWPSAYVRQHFREALDLAQQGRDVVVTHRGEPVVVLVAYENFADAILEYEDSRRTIQKAP